MSQREMLIVLAHALSCSACRNRLLGNPSGVFIGRSLTADEKEKLSKLTESDFATAELLARGTGTSTEDIRSYTDHPVARLRHFQ